MPEAQVLRSIAQICECEEYLVAFGEYPSCGFEDAGNGLPFSYHRLEALLAKALSTNAGLKEAGGMDEFFANHVKETDLPSLIPFERWSIERAYSPDVTPEKMYVRHAGFLAAVDKFDASAYR